MTIEFFFSFLLFTCQSVPAATAVVSAATTVIFARHSRGSSAFHLGRVETRGGGGTPSRTVRRDRKLVHQDCRCQGIRLALHTHTWGGGVAPSAALLVFHPRGVDDIFRCHVQRGSIASALPCRLRSSDRRQPGCKRSKVASINVFTNEQQVV